MNTIVRANNIELEPRIRQDIAAMLHRSLERFDDQLVDADIFLSDVNGPKGGIDKHVLIRVRMESGQVIATETRHEELQAALTLGVRKTKKSVKRSVKKSLKLSRRPLRDFPYALNPEA